MPGPIPRLGKSDPANLAAMEHVAQVANTGHVFSATGDMEAHATPSGRAILHNAVDRIFDRRTARIIAPESGGFTYADARYRLQTLHIKTSADAGGSPPKPTENVQLATDEDFKDLFPEGGDNGLTGANLDVGNHFTAVNLAEITTTDLKTASGSHTLREDGTVIVEAFCFYDEEKNPQPHWFFVGPGSSVVPVKLTASESAGGHYKGRIFTGSINGTNSTSSSLTLPSTLHDPGVDNALILNPPELLGSGTSHTLATSGVTAWGTGLRIGNTNEPTNRAVLLWLPGWSPPTPRPIYTVLMSINSSGDLAFDRPRLS